MLPINAFSTGLDPISALDKLYSDIDPFSTQDEVSASPAKDITTSRTMEPCQFTAIGVPLSLLEAVERALCNHPHTRQTWASVKAQAALVGTNLAAYMPTINASASGTYGNNKTTVKDYPIFSRDKDTSVLGYNLKLSWILFDFGLRGANLENAQQLLAAANATQDATLQTVFVTAAQSYYDLLSAQGALDASLDSEKSAKESYLAADAKYRAGAGTLADKLQAQTTYAQASLDRAKASGTLKNAHGTLAIAMGLSANTPLTIDDQGGELPDTTFVTSMDALIEDAKRDHPSLLAAQAQMQAAKAKVEAAKAEGLPSVALTGAISYNNQLGIAPGDTVTENDNIGVQVNVPLFEGFGRSYRIQSAKAQVEAKTAELANAEQQISLDVWKSYQSLQTESENLKATDHLSQSATQSFNVAQGRYKAGVGTIIELLSAQSTLASSRQQRIKALSNWRTARLKLANSLGKLGLWAI
ncbi:TolC family protein [Methylomonas sp. EbA]|uniref:Protein CyaE n=2 Tax=Methylomonas albis TaxID=1854563 RepID=A0ABR9D240_9GAMM|nr:TolC family protein [Methylomonas albis]